MPEPLPYHLGCSVWSLPEWVGSFYTPDAKPTDFLKQYASVYNAVEGNSTFYTAPSANQIYNWGKLTGSGFKFCFKFPREITHGKKLRHTEKETDDFLKIFEPIREKLGPFMIQLPPSFSPKEMHYLEQFISWLPKHLSYAVEVRHSDYFDRGSNEHNLNRLLESYGIDRVIFDTRKLHSINSQDLSIMEAKIKKPKVPVRFVATGSRPVIRFVATNDILNSEAYLKEWSIVIADWIKDGLHPYVFIHTPDKFSQPVLCHHFHSLLSQLIALPPLPDWPINREAQLGLF